MPTKSLLLGLLHPFRSALQLPPLDQYASQAKQSLSARDKLDLGQKVGLLAQLGLPAFVGINISMRPALLKDCHKADSTKEDYEVKWGKTKRKGSNEL